MADTILVGIDDRDIPGMIDRLEARVRELLEANNCEVERRREAERHLLAMQAVVDAARKLHTVADELCTAIDRAADDIGGSRPTRDILANLGPATDVAENALAALDKLREGR